MKLHQLLILPLLTLPLIAQSASLSFPTFPEQSLPDLRELGIQKEDLFRKLDRKDVKVGRSQCFNRAHVWAKDIETEHGDVSGKLFVFYTSKTGSIGEKSWWYHVAPMVNEGGIEYVIDGGFPSDIKGPLTVNEWVFNFISTTNCKVITPEDLDLFKRMYKRNVFPDSYQGKNYDCYLAKTPSAYWAPGSIADGILENKRKTALSKSEVYSACLEATTNPIGKILGSGRARCKRFK